MFLSDLLGHMAGSLAMFSRMVRRAAVTPSLRRCTTGATYQPSPDQVLNKQGSYEGPGKTTINILNEEAKGINMVDSFSQDGFRLNDDTKILGPCVVFPTAVLGWRVGGAEEITEESLALFTLLDPKLDVLVVGHGLTERERNPVDPRTILKMRSKGVNMEVLTTENAIATYNFLVEEGRVVAAALIPPNHVKLVDSDIVETKERYRKLLSTPDNNMFDRRRGEYKEF